MRSVVIVIVLPLAQFLVEQMNVVADAVLIEELVELLVIDAVRALDLAIEVWRARADVDVPDVEVLDVPMEVRLELCARCRSARRARETVTVEGSARGDLAGASGSVATLPRRSGDH